MILTHLLQLFTDKGITEHVAFKGGTMLRKMVFGRRGRLSTDLDFTCCTDIDRDDLMMMMLDALSEPYEGLSFQLKDKDWYLTEDGCAANPVCSHDDNKHGVNIKLQISTRERPILPVEAVPQLDQDYFKLLGFAPAAIPSLAFEEAVAEKIAPQASALKSATCMLGDCRPPCKRDLIRSVAVLKLWNSGGPGLDYGRFSEPVKGAGDYDTGDLANLLRKHQKPDLNGMMRRVLDGFRFLADLTREEKALAADATRNNRKEAEALIAALTAVAV